MLTPINKIAAEISVAFQDIRNTPGAHKKWLINVEPYVEAMLNVQDAQEFYGIDRAEDILLGFLNAAGDRWHGAQSDRIRTQLREHLYRAKEYHANHKS